MFPIATRSRKTRAEKIRMIDAIAIYLQHLKAEGVQLLECNHFKSDYCRRARIFRECSNLKGTAP